LQDLKDFDQKPAIDAFLAESDLFPKDLLRHDSPSIPEGSEEDEAEAEIQARALMTQRAKDAGWQDNNIEIWKSGVMEFRGTPKVPEHVGVVSQEQPAGENEKTSHANTVAPAVHVQHLQAASSSSSSSAAAGALQSTIPLVLATEPTSPPTARPGTTTSSASPIRKQLLENGDLRVNTGPHNLHMASDEDETSPERLDQTLYDIKHHSPKQAEKVQIPWRPSLFPRPKMGQGRSE
ncbi:unnamed protein product, partial [Amoebophrya sp. A120]